eukprot:SAG11_NODE_9024_length_952_cov_1.078546_2_plen_89_part_01
MRTSGLAAEVLKVDEAQHVDIFARVLARHAVLAERWGLSRGRGRAVRRAALLKDAERMLLDLDTHGLFHQRVLGGMFTAIGLGAVLLAV